jgi:hypothetical protein
LHEDCYLLKLNRKQSTTPTGGVGLRKSRRIREALKMLYDLLEEYAPSWYTEEHHDKAEAALRSVNNEVREN